MNITYSSCDIKKSNNLSASSFLALGRSEINIFMILFNIPDFVYSLLRDSRLTKSPVAALTLTILLVLFNSF